MANGDKLPTKYVLQNISVETQRGIIYVLGTLPSTKSFYQLLFFLLVSYYILRISSVLLFQLKLGQIVRISIYLLCR